jgi:AcrR family transcriptional regulator
MGDRPRRADARRNYERVLAAAKELFGELGVTAPLDEIARRAGVGNATMYRHFPTRRELVIAVYAGEVSTLCELGQSIALLADSSPVDALFRWLRAFIIHVATKRELPPDDTAGRVTGSPEEFPQRVSGRDPLGDSIPIFIYSAPGPDVSPWRRRIKSSLDFIEEDDCVLNIYVLAFPVHWPTEQEIAIARVGHGGHQAGRGVRVSVEHIKCLTPAAAIVGLVPESQGNPKGLRKVAYYDSSGCLRRTAAFGIGFPW